MRIQVWNKILYSVSSISYIKMSISLSQIYMRCPIILVWWVKSNHNDKIGSYNLEFSIQRYNCKAHHQIKKRKRIKILCELNTNKNNNNNKKKEENERPVNSLYRDLFTKQLIIPITLSIFGNLFFFQKIMFFGVVYNARDTFFFV